MQQQWRRGSPPNSNPPSFGSVHRCPTTHYNQRENLANPILGLRHCPPQIGLVARARARAEREQRWHEKSTDSTHAWWRRSRSVAVMPMGVGFIFQSRQTAVGDRSSCIAGTVSQPKSGLDRHGTSRLRVPENWPRKRGESWLKEAIQRTLEGRQEPRPLVNAPTG